MKRKRMGVHPLAALMSLKASTAALRAHLNRELGVGEPPPPRRLPKVSVGNCAATVAAILEKGKE